MNRYKSTMFVGYDNKLIVSINCGVAVAKMLGYGNYQLVLRDIRLGAYRISKILFDIVEDYLFCAKSRLEYGGDNNG
jgi:hypothetical protein